MTCVKYLRLLSPSNKYNLSLNLAMDLPMDMMNCVWMLPIIFKVAWPPGPLSCGTGFSLGVKYIQAFPCRVVSHSNVRRIHICLPGKCPVESTPLQLKYAHSSVHKWRRNNRSFLPQGDYSFIFFAWSTEQHKKSIEWCTCYGWEAGRPLLSVCLFVTRLH